MAETSLKSSPGPQSQAHQQTLLDFAVSQSSAIFYIADLAGDRPIRFISSNVEAITGHEPEAFLRQAKYGLRHVHRDDIDRYLQAMAALTEEGALTLEYRFKTAWEEFRWFRDDLRLIGDAAGKQEFVGCMIDITGEKEAQERLASVEVERRRVAQLLEDAVESLPNGFAIYDQAGRLVLANKSLALTGGGPLGASLVGLTREGVVMRRLPGVRSFGGRPVSATKKDAKWIEKRLRSMNNETVEVELQDGRWLLLSCHPTSEGGQVVASADITDQKRREAEFRHARETLEDAIEALSEGFVLYDADDKFVLCNSQYKAFHADSEDLLVPGASWRQVTQARAERGLFTAALGREEEWLAGQMAQRGIAQNEQFPFADGRWFEYSHRPTRQGGFVSTWREVTEQKHMEQALRENEALIRRILEACPLPVRMWRPKTGQVIYESPACRTMFGRDATKAPKSERLSVYVNAGDRKSYLARLHETGAVDGLEVRLRRADGSTFWAAVSARLTEYQGEAAVVSSIVDLSERRDMEQALRESEQMVRKVLEACPVPISMSRLDDGLLLYESPSAKALFNCDETTKVGSVASRWVDLDARNAYLERLKRDGAVDGLEVHYKKIGGEEFFAELSTRLIEFKGETVTVTNVFDLTDRKLAEAELAHQRERLHQSEKLSALGELLAGVSHELNNPLSVLVGQAQMLQETAPDATVKARAEKIGKAANRCARIVKTFLAMARQEPTEAELVDMNEVVDAALEITAYSLRTSGIEVSLRMAKELPLIAADPDQMRQVLTNLIVNAQHALQDVEGPRKLRISSSYRKLKREIVIKVKDNGPGIPEAVRSRIFEPLFTTKEIGSGTGIGLALCHRVVESHGGFIAVESGAKEGAAFAIRLPVGDGTAVLESEAPAATGAHPKYRVLVVDDEYDVGQIISDVLQNDGHRVEVARSGRSAMEMIDKHRYDVILSDIRMPQMDGPGFYRTLSDQRPELISGLAFITGDTMSPKVKEFLDASERPYLEKPVMPRDVRELVDLLTRRKRS
jgi:PAS domain S-box-containing protein